MKRRYISVILSGLMVLSALAACGSSNGTTTETTMNNTIVEGDTAKNIDDEKPPLSQLTVEVFDRGTDGGKTNPADNFYTDWIKAKVLEELNIEVTFVPVSRWEETTMLNNLMASGTAPDVCLTYSNDLITNFRELGGLVNLEPYIDTHLLDLKEFLGVDFALQGRDLIRRNADSETGEIYSIPSRVISEASMNTFIRKDWLDALDLPLPTTTEEYYDALVAFRDYNPGNVDKVVPLIITSDVDWRARPLLYSFINPDLTEEERWVYSIVDSYTFLPGYKEGVRFLNKMYHENLIDRQFMLYQDDVDSDNLIKIGAVGSFMHNWDQAYRDSPGLLKDLLENVPTAEIVTIDPFVNAAGKTPKNPYNVTGVNWFIPSFSKNVDAALRYVNWLAKFKNRYFLQVGEEGITHELVDGIPKMLTTTGPQIMNSVHNIDYTIPINGIDMGDHDKTVLARAFAYDVHPDIIRKAYADSIRDNVPGMVVPVNLTASAPYTQTLIDKRKQLMAAAITTDPQDFDRVWDSGVQDMLDSGGQLSIDERREKYFTP